MNLSDMKVPALSSIPQFQKKAKVELIQHFGKLQLRISSSSFGVPRHLNLSGLNCIVLNSAKRYENIESGRVSVW